MYSDLERNFNVIYPDSERTTYQSILNYSKEYDNPFQRWYRYKEGYSIEFVNNVIEEYLPKGASVILDPFAGSGTTVIAANRLGLSGVGYEINPFSYFLMSVKGKNYTEEDAIAFKKSFEKILRELEDDLLEKYELPKLSISGQVFLPEVETYVMSCKTKIKKVQNEKIRDLLFLGWLACIEELSIYRKAGNGLKKKTAKKSIAASKGDVIDKYIAQYTLMYEDISTNISFDFSNKLFNKSCLNFSDDLHNDSVDGIIFSPPYANCFDYIEIYKLELWFGDFVQSYDDLKVLRMQSLKSHLNRAYDYKTLKTEKSEVLTNILSEVSTVELWDKKIPQMLYGYFEDMFNIIDNSFKTLRNGGFCAIVVGNSAYGGVIIPTDLILAEYAKKIGFVVDKIEVDRFIITSSQQYEKTKDNRKYLRESVVCLQKK